MPETEPRSSESDRLRAAENVLKRLGFSRVPPARREGEGGAAFWVQEAGVPRRTFPVFVPLASPASDDRIEEWASAASGAHGLGRRAIFVVPSDRAADEAWARLSRRPGTTIDNEVSVLVVPTGVRAPPEAGHFHLRIAEPREILALATGIVVGLFRRARASDEPGQVDFEELLALLKARFGVDVHRSLGVKSDEDALYLLYQLALRDAYAPGDPGTNLHLLVLKPTGPAARLPWFAG
ncbi:MAG TPA: hypothetical protein VEL82_07865 [Thermoplasmata archaeon]|nr:hypothetical protein [Thermoplasmata archaeon]